MACPETRAGLCSDQCKMSSMAVRKSSSILISAIGLAVAHALVIPQYGNEPGQHYHHLFGTKYRTNTALYLFRFINVGGNDDDNPKYIGTRDEQRSFWPSDFPKTVSS